MEAKKENRNFRSIVCTLYKSGRVSAFISVFQVLGARITLNSFQFHPYIINVARVFFLLVFLLFYKSVEVLYGIHDYMLVCTLH